MKRANTAWRAVEAAAVGWTDSGHPVSLAYDDVYYSAENGCEESRYVYLRGNELPQRWQTGATTGFCVAETGFGTGLNFLLTWAAWRNTPGPVAQLHYLSFEKHPLRKSDLATALSAWPELAPLAAQLLEQYPGLVPGQHRVLLEDGRLVLDLWWEDVEAALPDMAGLGRTLVDAWYLDGFTPARNTAMWESGVLAAVARLSRPGATFSTFTAAGKVRRQLESAGFLVTKVPGYGKKRDCLRGRLEHAGTRGQEYLDTPWDLPTEHRSSPRTAIVLGAGLAGTTAAAALARRGIEVTVLEKGKTAGAGSANDQGILYTRLSRRHSALTDFSLQSYRFSSNSYRNLFATGALEPGLDGALCGTFHQNFDATENALMASALEPLEEFATVLDASAANDKLGVAQNAAGYWFPGSGWLKPAAVCRASLQTPGIELVEDCGQVSLGRTVGGWLATGCDGQTWEADCVVIAAGTNSKDLAGLEWLPLQAIRGQTTRLPTSQLFSELRAALCHTGYIAPARAGEHCIGATFDLDDFDESPRAGDHQNNLAKLASAVPGWQEALAQLDPARLKGQVAYRCASPDYLPLVGPVPDREAFLQDFAALRKNAKQTLPRRGQFLPGLYLSTAHGSRGLTSAPLAAELLASQICGEAPPLCRELGRALAPARFIIRDLRRNRI